MNLNGADIEKVEMRYNGKDQRAVHAKKNIYAGETVIFVPCFTKITLHIIYNSSVIGRQLYKMGLYHKLHQPISCLMAVYFLEELRKPKIEQVYGAYLDLFPTDMSSYPIYFTQEELKYLEGSPFLESIEAKKLLIRQDFETIRSNIPTFDFSIEDFTRMALLAASRRYGE